MPDGLPAYLLQFRQYRNGFYDWLLARIRLVRPRLTHLHVRKSLVLKGQGLSSRGMDSLSESSR